MRRSIMCGCALAAAVLMAGPAWSQSWGDVKGQVVYAGQAPVKQPVAVNKDQGHCLSQGTLFDDALLVDPATKGVKNVMVWLAPATPGGPLPVHPTLAPVPKEKVVIDQPCCLFVPRIAMMREGQQLEIRNSAPVLHNAKITGSATVNGTINLTIPPGQSITKEPRAEKRPMQITCDIHAWMGGRIAVFNHPYFALTRDDGTFEIKNAPAGKYKIFLQHEKLGWVHKGQKATGQDIEIKSGTATAVGKFEAKAD